MPWPLQKAERGHSDDNNENRDFGERDELLEGENASAAPMGEGGGEGNDRSIISLFLEALEMDLRERKELFF